MCKGCYKKCFAAGTQFQIVLDDREPRLATAEEIFNWVSVERPVDILSVNGALNETEFARSWKRVSSVWSSGKPEPTVEIRHASFGAIQHLQLTPDHLVRTLRRGDVQAKDVTPEDQLLTLVLRGRDRAPQAVPWQVGRVEPSAPSTVFGIEVARLEKEGDIYIVANGLLAVPIRTLVTVQEKAAI